MSQLACSISLLMKVLLVLTSYMLRRLKFLGYLFLTAFLDYSFNQFLLSEVRFLCHERRELFWMSQ